MSHRIKYINIICTDPRIQKFYHDYLAGQNLFGNFDTIQYENPILELIDKKRNGAFIERIKNFIKLHGPDTVVIFDHYDCGAYRLNGYNFVDFNEEQEAHMANNKKAVEIIKNNILEIKEVEIKYIFIDAAGKCSWR